MYWDDITILPQILLKIFVNAGVDIEQQIWPLTLKALNLFLKKHRKLIHLNTYVMGLRPLEIF